MVRAQMNTMELPDKINPVENNRSIRYLPRMERYEAGKLKRKDFPLKIRLAEPETYSDFFLAELQPGICFSISPSNNS
jgi:hypothetical protein